MDKRTGNLHTFRQALAFNGITDLSMDEIRKLFEVANICADNRGVLPLVGVGAVMGGAAGGLKGALAGALGGFVAGKVICALSQAQLKQGINEILKTPGR